MLLIVNAAIGQQQSIDTLLQKFDSFRITATTEKIYVHTDQKLSLTGETMWFKLYVVNATSHKPSNTSKVAYVEVLDNVNQPVLQTKIALNGGFGSGSLFIPASLTSGNYTLRVYTAWMRNFSPSYYFHKTITVINPFRRLEPEKKNPIQRQVQFFPEGGTLLNGIPTRIAFRVTGPVGEKDSLLIQLSNGDNLFVQPDLYGLGSFTLTPQAGARNTAVLKPFSGKAQSFELPAGASSGYSLRVADSTETLLSVNLRKLNVTDDLLQVYVLIHARNMVFFARVQRLRGGQATIAVPRNILAEGISQITLFDSEMRPVCERLYFSPVKRILSISATQGQQEYGVRRKVALDFNVNDENGPVAGSNLSVAVYRRDSLRSNVSDILNTLWLESDLEDVPALPTDFLVRPTAENKTTLEDIMLTHGWRRFKWTDVVESKKAAISFVPEVRGHIIRGKVVDMEGQPESGKMTYLSAPGTNIQVYGSVSKKNGDVQYEMKDFSGIRRIVIQTNLSQDSTSKITIQSPFSREFAPTYVPPFSLSPNVANILNERTFSMQVQDIYYQDKGAQTRTVAVDTTAFYGKADATYYLDDYTRFPVMEEIMREYVPGVLVRKRRDGFHFINLDVVNKTVFSEDPFIMLDGLPIFDADKIMAFDPLKIRKLEVVTRRYYMGVLSLPGIVSYTTYAGDLGGYTIDPHCVVLNYEGLQLQREYYTPTYENAKQRESRMPDQRDRLFWAPSLTTDKNGKQHLEFYTSDLTGSYEVLVEGMSPGGASGSGKTKFNVVSLND